MVRSQVSIFDLALSLLGQLPEQRTQELLDLTKYLLLPVLRDEHHMVLINRLIIVTTYRWGAYAA